MDKQTATVIAGEIIRIFNDKGGNDYAGEKITQLEHACQAAELAEEDGQDNEVILAAFLHDIGHLLNEDPHTEDMGDYGVKDHETVGADYLATKGFGKRLCDLVSSHVAAKRYLCAVNKRYFEQLSFASKMTLVFQGGPMSDTEVLAFEANPLKNLIIKMRTWDEQAKVENKPMPDLAIYRTKLITYLTQL